MAITWPFGKTSQTSTSTTPSQVDPMNDGAASTNGSNRYDTLSPANYNHHLHPNDSHLAARDRDTSALLRRQLSYEPESDPDERSRLLPARSSAQPLRNGVVRGPLDPDDPAVSPYNLWTVRGLRWFTILFLILSIFWWVLLLVSQFVSPPMMNSRGSGFYEFIFASVSVAMLLVTLIFFTIPSRAEQYSSLAVALLLFVDAIIILAVGRLRTEAGWIGIATVLWAMLMSFWVVLCDRVVEYGKAEEEQRLTGRQETKRSLKEWAGVFASTILTVLLIFVTACLTLTLIMRAHDATLAVPGKKYAVDSHKYEVHLACQGPRNASDVTVLLEAGENPVEDGMTGWVQDAHRNGTIARFCYWDRPGMGWSDNAPSPLSAGMAADALAEALAVAGEEGPWVLVSHGIGGIYSRIFASRHGMQVKGMLLIDNLHESLLEEVGSPTRGFKLWLRGVISPVGLDRLWGWMFRGHSSQDRVFGKAAWQNGRFIKAKLQESLVARTYTRNEIHTARVILSREVPLAVVSSGKMVKTDKRWYEAQHDLSALSDKLIGWDIVDHAPHDVWATLEGRRTLEKRLGQLVA